LKLPDQRLRLAFFGTPDIARTILDALLLAKEDDVVLVVCQPDRPKGRGKQLEMPAVKVLANEHAIPVVQPLKMRDGVLTQRLKDDRIDLAIVAAFGRILPQDMLDAPRFGCWNMHASLLPKYRGASPIQHAILHGDAETGATLMQMSLGLDEGPMLLVEKIALSPDETTPTLSAKLGTLGAHTVLEGIRRARKDGLTVTPQDDARATFAPIIDKEAGRLDLTKPAAELERRVRALDPWPGTWVVLPNGETLKVLKAEVGSGGGAPGTVLGLGKAIEVATGDGVLRLLSVQPVGKRPMPAADWLRGGGKDLTSGQICPLIVDSQPAPPAPSTF